MQDRLKAKLWVQAHIRQCQSQGMMAMVVHSGDPDAGSLLLKVNQFAQGCAVYVPVTDMDGNRAWMRALRDDKADERACDSYIQREISRDSDLWVLEIEDYKGSYGLDAPLLT